MCGNVLTNGIGADGDHILAGGIAGEVFEGQDDVVAFHIQVNVCQFTMAGFALGDLEKSSFLIGGPNQETDSVFNGIKTEQGAAAHAFGEAGAGNTTSPASGFGATVVGSNEGAFSGG